MVTWSLAVTDADIAVLICEKISVYLSPSVVKKTISALFYAALCAFSRPKKQR
jgi:hypothetical protein